MGLKTKLAALPYAHLLGIAAAKADDDEMKQKADESDEDYAKRMEDDDKKDKEKEDKNNDDEDAKAEDDDKKEKSKSAKSKAEDDDEKKDDDKKDKESRKAERSRCAAIFQCAEAAVRPDMAAHLAFSTDMSASEATSMLKTICAGATPARGLASRMAEVKTPNVGASAGQSPDPASPEGVAAQVIAAGKARRGEA